MKRVICTHTLVALTFLAQILLSPTTWAIEKEGETKLPSAASKDLQTGITTRSTKNADGSRTVRTTDKNGKLISKEEIPPRGKASPSAELYDPATGNTTSSTKNADGSRTVRTTDKNGKLISKEEIPPRGTASPSAESYDPATGITTSSTKNADGSRTVRTTDKNGKLISKEEIPPRGTASPSAEAHYPAAGVTVTYTTNADGSRTVRVTNTDGTLIGERRIPKRGTGSPSASAYDPKTREIRYAYANLLVNGNAEEGDTHGWVDKDSAWSADDEITPHGGSYFFWPAKKTLARTELYQDVDLSHIADKLDAGDLYLQLSGSLCNWDQSPCDQSIMILEVLDGKGTILFRSPKKVHQDSNWKDYKINTTCPVGARVLRVRLIAQRRCGSDNDGYFDDIVLGLSTKPFSKE